MGRHLVLDFQKVCQRWTQILDWVRKKLDFKHQSEFYPFYIACRRWNMRQMTGEAVVKLISPPVLCFSWSSPTRINGHLSWHSLVKSDMMWVISIIQPLFHRIKKTVPSFPTWIILPPTKRQMINHSHHVLKYFLHLWTQGVMQITLNVVISMFLPFYHSTF